MKVAQKKMTAAAIPTLPPGDHPDDLVPALMLRVGVRRKTWTVRHRMQGKYRADKIGYYPAMSLAAAREAARRLLERAEAGIVPEPPVPHPKSDEGEAAGGMTLDQALTAYQKKREIEGGKGIKTLSVRMQQLRKDLADYLATPVGGITKADLRAARDKVLARGKAVQARNMLAYLGPIMKWLAREDHIEVNLVPAIDRPPPRIRQRVLTPDEIAAIWHACGRLDKGRSAPAYGRLVRFLLLTGQRRDEARVLKAGDILDGRWKWHKNKSDRRHSLKLPQLALDQLEIREPWQLCFEGESGMLNGFSDLKQDLDAEAGVTDWRHHDLRRTCRTYMEEDCRVPRYVAKAVLNHAEVGLDAVYAQGELDELRGEALQKWADVLAAIVAGRRAKVA